MELFSGRSIKSRFRHGSVREYSYCFFVFFPSAFTAAFSGVKYIAGQMGTGAQIEITSFVLSLIILCASTVVFGRFFCGFACAFGSLSDWVRAAYV